MVTSRARVAQFNFLEDKFLALIIIFCIGLLSADAPGWSVGISMTGICWRMLVEIGLVKIPSRWLTGIAAILVFFLAYLEHKTLLGRDASVTILIALIGLTSLEYSNQRNRLFLFLFCLALIGFKFLYQIDLWIAVPSLLATSGIFLLMLPANVPKFRIFIFHFISALPLVALLFFIFPRQQFRMGVGFGSNADDSLAQSGFSEDLRPGSVSELIKVKETAFRVQFLNDVFLTRDLYWRGSVLTKSNGLNWSKTSSISSQDVTLNPDASVTAVYNILMEPHGQNWLFTLERTSRIQSDDVTTLKNRNSVFISTGQVFRGISYIGYFSDRLELKASQPQDYLQVPTASAELKKFLEPLEKLKTTENKVSALMGIFSKDFSYTLTPGITKDMDEFLFNSRKGFCEHYAGATATILRNLGIPARVVVGYQGGTYNRSGDFWKVSQGDAHAWTEYVNDSGLWTRLDPTAFVAPSRILNGSASLAPQDFFSELGFSKDKFQAIELWGDFVSFLESLNYRWNIFLVDFDQKYQKELFRLILAELKNIIAYIGFGISSLIVIALALKKLFSKKVASSQEQKYFIRIENWLSSREFLRPANEPPLEFLNRAASAFPEKSELINKVALAYRLKIYENNPDQNLIREIKRQIRSL